MACKKNKKITEQMLHYRGADGVSHEERLKRVIRSVPGGKTNDFDGFMTTRQEAGPKLGAGLIRRLLADADAGEAAEQVFLFQEIIEKEPVVTACLQTRILSVLACDWTIDGADKSKAAEASEIFSDANIFSLLRHLLDAVAYGYSGAAIIWGEGGAKIDSFKKLDPACWRFDAGGNPALAGFDGTVVPVAEHHPNQFVLHTHGLQFGIPSRGGLLRPLVWLYLFKHYAMRDRARYLEKFGMPFIIAKIRNDDFENESVRASILESLAKVTADGSGVVTEGSELQITAPSSGGTSDHQAWMEYIDRMTTLLVLGQTATTGDASGFSRGQIQENVRMDILEADCRALAETVNSQVLAPLEYYRYGTRGTLEFKLDFDSPENLTEKAAVVKTLSECGFTFDPEWVSKTFAVKINDKEKRQ